MTAWTWLGDKSLYDPTIVSLVDEYIRHMKQKVKSASLYKTSKHQLKFVQPWPL